MDSFPDRIFVDVGGRFNSEEGYFDHHQRGGAGERVNGWPYASAGLIWKYYGLALCDNEETLHQRIDKKYIMKIDAVDSGYFKEIDFLNSPLYLHEMISSLNVTWYEDAAKNDDNFLKAVNFAASILKGIIKREKGIFLADEIIQKSIKNSANDNYLILEQMCPYESYVMKETNFKYVIFPGQMEDKYMIKPVLLERGLRGKFRHAFPESWAGLTGEELQQISGVPDAHFCHNDRFIASALSLEGAIAMVEKSLSYY